MLFLKLDKILLRCFHRVNVVFDNAINRIRGDLHVAMAKSTTLAVILCNRQIYRFARSGRTIMIRSFLGFEVLTITGPEAKTACSVLGTLFFSKSNGFFFLAYFDRTIVYFG